MRNSLVWSAQYHAVVIHFTYTRNGHTPHIYAKHPHSPPSITCCHYNNLCNTPPSEPPALITYLIRAAAAVRVDRAAAGVAVVHGRLHPAARVRAAGVARLGERGHAREGVAWHRGRGARRWGGEADADEASGEGEGLGKAGRVHLARGPGTCTPARTPGQGNQPWGPWGPWGPWARGPPPWARNPPRTGRPGVPARRGSDTAAIHEGER